MIVYKDNEYSECFRDINEQNWSRYYNKLLLKKKKMNEYNSKLILIEALKKIGISTEYVGNDTILGEIVILFQKGLNYFFPIKLDVQEIFEEGACGRYNVDWRKIKYIVDDVKEQENFDKYVEKVFNFLKDKIIVENIEGKCKIKVCEAHFIYGSSRYILTVEDFNDIATCNPDLYKILIKEIVCDSKQNDIISTNKKIDVTSKCKGFCGCSNQISGVEITTRTDIYHLNQMIGIKESRYVGSIDKPMILFTDDIEPNRQKIDILVKDGMASGILLKYNGSRNQTYSIENQEVCYIGNFIDYVKWQQYLVTSDISDIAQEKLEKLDIISCDSTDLELFCELREEYIDILSDRQLAYYQSIGLNPEDYMLNAQYEKFMGTFWQIDENTRKRIIKELKNQSYQEGKQKIKCW